MTSTPIPLSVQAIVPQSFLARLPPGVIADVLGTGRLAEVPARTMLTFSQAKPGVGIVIEGLVRVFLKSPNGRQVTILYARPGETLGLVELLRGRLEVHAQAVTPAILFALSPRKLRALAEQSAPLAMAIAEDCAVRVAETVDELAHVTFGSVRQRVARHLLDLAAAEGDESDLVAAVTVQTLADATGSVREVVTRVLKELHATGATERAAHGVTILDAARLDVEARGPL